MSDTKPKSEIGGGFIIHRRNKRNGKYQPGRAPHEHGSLEIAKAEAERLAQNNPGHSFCVMQQVFRVRMELGE